MAIIELEDIEETRKISPFLKFKIQDDSELYKKTERITCPDCNRRMKYFCYYCFKVMGMDRTQVPFVSLPVPIDIIKHEYESDGKSTALHACVIADQDAKLYNWKEMPQYEQPERILMLFPGQVYSNRWYMETSEDNGTGYTNIKKSTEKYAEKYKGKYEGEYDNLLFYFKHLYDLIQYTYQKGEHKDKTFCHRHKSNYIKDQQ